MRNYAEMMERLEYHAPEGHTVTDAEVCATLADNHAARTDYAREYERDAIATSQPELSHEYR